MFHPTPLIREGAKHKLIVVATGEESPSHREHDPRDHVILDETSERTAILRHQILEVCAGCKTERDVSGGCLFLQVTGFNKIAIQNYKFQMTSGQGKHWFIESPTICSSMYSPPLSDICKFYF